MLTVTLSPTCNGPRVVTANVNGIRATLNRSGSLSTIVKLTPSTAIEPFGARNGASRGGTSKVTRR